MQRHRFDFPLNVYAAMLEWEEGCVDHLHFGLFEQADEPALKAQERASDRLWAAMPPACRVLEVGVGLATTLRRLQQRGYAATGITPDAAQVAAALERQGGGLDIRCTTLQALQPPDGAPYELMLLEQSAQYIEPMDLFEAADRLLTGEHATLLLIDEFALRRDSEDDYGLHKLQHFKDLAQRYGWRLSLEQDCSAQAAVSVQRLLDLLARYRRRLQSELALDDATLDELQSSLLRYRDLFSRGVYGYVLLRMERGPRPALRPVVVAEHNALAMRQLFHRVFGREMDAVEWHWKYGDGRGGGVGLLRREDGALVAFYGGLSRPLKLLGESAWGSQICDVMVEATSRSSLARRGPGYFTMASYVEAQIGCTKRHAVGFGFPTTRALGVAQRQGIYQRVDDLIQLHWSPGAGSPALEPIDLATLQADGDPWRHIDALWVAMAHAMTERVLGVRDAQWVHYRYGQNPRVRYEGVLLRDAPHGPVTGLLVYRLHVDHIEVMDVVGHPARYADLIDAARTLAAQQPQPTVVKAWITRSQAMLLRRDGDGCELDELNIVVPGNIYTPGVTVQMLQDRWFLMAGDTDFR